MLSSFDYKFNYFTLLRFVLLNKIGCLTNVNYIPCIEGLYLFFSLKNATVLDNSQNFNFFYFFKFFFGRNAYITNFQSTFSFGETFHSYNVELFLKKNDLYFFLFYLSNDIFFLLDKDSIFINRNFFFNNYNNLFLSIKDLSIFSEIKTNIGLFDLKSPLNIKFIFSGFDSISNKILFNNLKFLYT